MKPWRQNDCLEWVLIWCTILFVKCSALAQFIPPSWKTMCQAEVSHFQSYLTTSQHNSYASVVTGNGSHFHRLLNQSGTSYSNSDKDFNATQEQGRRTTQPKDAILVNISCQVPKSRDVQWKLMDLHDWQLDNEINARTAPSNRSQVYAVSVRCESGAKISLPWPVKAIGLHEVHVRNCGLVDQFALVYSRVLSDIPDELQVLVIRDSFRLVDLDSPNRILQASLEESLNLEPDYECGQDQTLRVYIQSNVTHISLASFDSESEDGPVDNSTSEKIVQSADDETTMHSVRPEDRLVTDRESLISDQGNFNKEDLLGLEALLGSGDSLSKIPETNFTAKQDMFELRRKIKNTRIYCKFEKLLSFDESLSSETPTHLLQVATQNSDYPVLEVLNYSRIGMTRFPRELSQWRLYFPRLRYLDLSYNAISRVRVENYPLMPGTPRTIINIRHNNMTVLNPGILKAWARVKNFHVDMRDNPIACDCDMKPLVKFLHDDTNFNGRMEQYMYVTELRCHSPPDLSGRKLKSLSTGDLPCKVFESSQALVVILAVMLAAFILLTVILIRYKVEIRVLLYTRLHLRLPCDSDAHRQDKVYDAFVSYSNQDSPWVLENLVQYLETDPEAGQKSSSFSRKQQQQQQYLGPSQRSFKLCLHQRDFIPGKTIVDNIVDSIEASRHTIIVLSPSFMRSHWAMEELRQAYRQSLVERKRHLIVLLLEKIPVEEMDPLISRCVKTFTYLQVQDAIFKDKLVFSLTTKDRASRRRDRLVSKHRKETMSETSKDNSIAASHDNPIYIQQPQQSPDSHNTYHDIVELSAPSMTNTACANVYETPRYDVINDPAQSTRISDVVPTFIKDCSYYSCNGSRQAEAQNGSASQSNSLEPDPKVTGTRTRPEPPERILSNSSTSSTSALTWSF